MTLAKKAAGSACGKCVHFAGETDSIGRLLHAAGQCMAPLPKPVYPISVKEPSIHKNYVWPDTSAAECKLYRWQT